MLARAPRDVTGATLPMGYVAHVNVPRARAVHPIQPRPPGGCSQLRRERTPSGAASGAPRVSRAARRWLENYAASDQRAEARALSSFAHAPALLNERPRIPG